jgi:hypothetical protein
VIAILGVVFLEGLALWKGVDGKFFGIAVTAVSGIAGFTFREILFMRSRIKKKEED